MLRRVNLRVLRLLVTANDPSSTILVTLMMEAIRASETSLLIKATQSNIPEADVITNFTVVSLVNVGGRGSQLLYGTNQRQT
jgi:hypothetical protein